MAKKISQLTQATEVKSDDVTVIVQDGETKKLPLNMMVTKQDVENKKIAGLAKLDEIEATYENDTYTPTITVKNKSSVKTGEGDEVDYSANVMDGHVKSAILKGQTLNNIIKKENKALQGNNITENENDYIVTGNAGILLDHSLFKPSTIYTAFLRVSGNGTVFVDNASRYYVSSQRPTYDVSSPMSIKLVFTTISDFSTLTVNVPYHFKIGTENVVGSVTIGKEIMVLEGDYTNSDIPYFEGMQSVKMPVLTTTGKNLFNGNIIENSVTKIEVIENIECISTLPMNNLKSIVEFEHPIKLDDGVIISFVVKVDGYLKIKPIFEDDTFGSEIGTWNPVNPWTKLSFIVPSNSKKIKGFTCIASSSGVRAYIQKETVQIEQGTKATSYEPYKTNILSTSEDVELRGIGDVRDELNLLTGEITERVGEVVLSDSNSIALYGVDTDTHMSFRINGLNWCSQGIKFICDKFPYSSDVGAGNKEGIYCLAIYNLYIRISKNKLTSHDINGFKEWLNNNPLTIQYELATESIKTVDLIPSGTHPSTTPYCWKNGRIQLSSSGLLPNLEYSVVTSRAGQINQNATMIVKNDKRIFDLEILLAGGLVNTTYQALTLQNQVETGLSKVSLSSEKEPDYLLYHMIMKLIEEKAYKLDDLAEKVSVFYLYEKLSDEQFETIYSELYPFVEDEIVEEPVVEELPEVVEDEVIM